MEPGSSQDGIGHGQDRVLSCSNVFTSTASFQFPYSESIIEQSYLEGLFQNNTLQLVLGWGLSSCFKVTGRFLALKLIDLLKLID